MLLLITTLLACGDKSEDSAQPTEEVEETEQSVEDTSETQLEDTAEDTDLSG